MLLGQPLRPQMARRRQNPATFAATSGRSWPHGCGPCFHHGIRWNRFPASRVRIRRWAPLV